MPHTSSLVLINSHHTHSIYKSISDQYNHIFPLVLLTPEAPSGTQANSAVLDLAKFQHPLWSITSAHSSTGHHGSSCRNKERLRAGKIRIRKLTENFILISGLFFGESTSLNSSNECYFFSKKLYA